MKQTIKLTEGELKNIIKEVFDDLENDENRNHISIDDAYLIWHEIADGWFDDWTFSMKKERFSTKFLIKYSQHYLDVMENDKDWIRRFGKKLLSDKKRCDFTEEEINELTEPEYLKIFYQALHNHFTRYLKSLNNKVEASKQQRIKTRMANKKEQERQTILGRITPPSDETKSEMGSMWNDYFSDPKNPTNNLDFDRNQNFDKMENMMGNKDKAKAKRALKAADSRMLHRKGSGNREIMNIPTGNNLEEAVTRAIRKYLK